MSKINKIEMHTIEMRIFEQCELNSFAVLEARDTGSIDQFSNIEQIISADERLFEKNTLRELVDFCKSHYDRNFGFQSIMDDGIHCFYTCSIVASKFIPFAEKHPALMNFAYKCTFNEVSFIEISFPEKIKKILIDEFTYNENYIARIFIEKQNGKDGPNFLIYSLSENGDNLTKITYMLERIYDCTIHTVAQTNTIKKICDRIKNDIKNNTGLNYINELDFLY